MKYLAFAGDTYYASGGWSDYAGAGDDLDTLRAETLTHATNEWNDWFHIVDVEKGEIIETWKRAVHSEPFKCMYKV